MRENSMQRFLDILSGGGNSNVLYGFISYYQQHLDSKFKSNTSLKDPIYNSHEYFMWLLLNTLRISNRLENICFRIGIISRVDEKTSYDKMITKIKKSIPSNVKKKMSSLALVLELRHSFVHYGLPNIIRKSKIKNQILKCQKDYSFTKSVFEETNLILNAISVPKVTDPTNRITIGGKE